MFDKLFQGLQDAMNPFKGFLGDLWKVWVRDAGRAVLMARWSWEDLPEDLVRQAAIAQQQAQAAQAARAIDDQVSAQLGAMGIFPGSRGAMPFGFGMNPDHAVFVVTMGTIRANRGDPPATPPVVQTAEAVLRGQLDPVAALIAAAPPMLKQQLAAVAQVANFAGMGHLLRLQGILAAAFALPRDRIPVLLPEVERKGEAAAIGKS
jgi:hypothetical protein